MGPEFRWVTPEKIQTEPAQEQVVNKPERRSLLGRAVEGLRGLGERLNLISADAAAAEAIAREGDPSFQEEITASAREMVQDLLQSGGEFLENRALAARNALGGLSSFVAGWRERAAQREKGNELRRIVAEQEEQLFRISQEIDLFEHRRHDKYIREDVDGAYYSRALQQGNLRATAAVAEQSELYFDPNMHNQAYLDAYAAGDLRTMLDIDFRENGGTGEPRTLMQKLALQKSILLSSRSATANRLEALRQRLSALEGGK